MDYILRGEPKEVAKVIRENRIRLQRGVISITPVVPETVKDDFGSEDSKDVEITDTKAFNTKTTKRSSKKSE